jgi:hypothetical protein
VLLTNYHVLVNLCRGDPVTQPACFDMAADNIGEYMCDLGGRLLVENKDRPRRCVGVDVAVASVCAPGLQAFKLNAIHELAGLVAETRALTVRGSSPGTAVAPRGRPL